MTAADFYDSAEGASLLAAYVSQDADGLYVDPAQLARDLAFDQFVDRLFLSGARFRGLDYAIFQGLLHEPMLLLAKGGKVRLADGIVPFAPERRALYKTVRILDSGARAEYVFEPVTLDPPEQTPGAEAPVPVPAVLDFDEFVADMWQKGLRFGIDAKKVKSALREGVFNRIDVAFQLAPTPGTDAEIQEANPDLHRDNSPKVLANGRADLRKFKNRFPHVDKNAPLLRKVRAVPGKPGRKVTGEVVMPPEPQDFDLGALAGPGTRIEEGVEGDTIMAAMDGFLTLDLGSNQVSVTEKIENRGGISARTTGDLNLAVDEFVEFGEVQEGRVVEGKHMTFKSDVYGMLVSLNGNIVVEANLSGGGARAQGGDVTVGGRASCAVLEAWDGKISAQFAEGCTIVGKVVSIERAVNCDIIAHELHVGVAEGCGIVAEFAHVASADMRKNQETVISLAIPDIALFDEKIVEARKATAGAASLVETKSRAIEELRADPEFARFLALGETLRQGKIRLNETQQENWGRLESRYASRLRQLHALEHEREALQKQCAALEAEVARLGRERTASGRGIGCEIAEVLGDSVVQTVVSASGAGAWRNLSGAELKSRLHSLGTRETRLFQDSSGSFSWRFSVPESDPA